MKMSKNVWTFFLICCKICVCGYGGMADALDLGSSPKGWRFKSSYPHQIRIIRNKKRIGTAKLFKNFCQCE